MWVRAEFIGSPWTGSRVFITGIIQGEISNVTCYFSEINWVKRLMWINVTLNVIIKNYVSLNYCKAQGDVFLFPFFFLYPRFHREDPSVKNSHFSCFGSRHCSTFWTKCHNGFYWSLMSGALSDAKVTMLSASPNRINRCCDSRAFHKRPQRRSILSKNLASISVGWWKDKARTSFEFITVMTILPAHIVAPTVHHYYPFRYCIEGVGKTYIRCKGSSFTCVLEE